MAKYKEAEICTVSSVEIISIVDEVIGRTGVIKDLTLRLPRTCLSDVLQALNKGYQDTEFTLIFERDNITLHLRSA